MTTEQSTARSRRGTEFVRRVTQALHYACASAIFAIVVVTVIDVFGRYILSKPLPGAAEIIQFAMALTIFTGLPLITKDREHIAVDLLGHLRGWPRRVKQVVVDLVSLAVVGVIGSQLFVQARDYRNVGINTDVLGLPMAPLAFTMALLSCVAALVLLALLWCDLVAGEQP